MSDPITDLKHELLAAAERRHIRAPAPVHRRRFGGRGGAIRLLPIGAALAVAAAAALFLTAPWSNSPSFLARAQAALTPPKGMILHEKWVLTDSACRGVRWTGEFWIDEPTQRFRALMRDGNAPYPHPPELPAPWAKPVCSAGRAYEIGGFPDEVFQFVPPNRLVRTVVNWGEEQDPVGDLRRAIRAGEAYDEGKTKRNDRTVERILLGDCPPSYCLGPHADAVCRLYTCFYVDPETFYPVEIHDGRGSVTRFAAFEYLPRTDANLALTNIRAQHPDATRPDQRG
jgi:hypothetical protein